MKKILPVFLALLLIFSINISIVCEVLIMPDGGKFDPEYYAEMNPDVAAIFGNDVESLYQHYLMFGVSEDRRPYKGAPKPTPRPVTTPKVTSAITMDATPDQNTGVVSTAVPTVMPSLPVTSTLSDIPADIAPIVDVSAASTKVVINNPVTDNKVRKCAVILGDSRTVAVMSILLQDASWKKTYYIIDNSSSTCIMMKDQNVILITGEAGGDIVNGAYDRAFARINGLMNTRNELINCSSWKVFNLFGVNDLLVDRIKTGAPYIKADENMLMNLPHCDIFYQFNAGPVSPLGWEYEYTTNEDIEAYNKGMLSVTSPCIFVVDFYQYLTTAGYNVILDASDMSGVHYDDNTNKKIISYILGMI